MAIIIPHQLPLAPHPLSPLPFSADRFPIHSGPLFCFHQSAFLFPAIFSPVPFGLLSCFLWSASSFLSVRYSLSFVPRSCSLRPASPFPSVCFPVSFGLLLCPLCSVSCFLWSGSTKHYFVVSSFPSLSSLPFCQVFSPLSNPTHALQRSRRRPSTFETTPFLLQEHALQRSRTRPSSPVSVCAWFRVSCKLCITSFLPPCVGTFVCVLVKFFHTPKRLVGSFFSHRFSQMNRSLSANRGNSPTPAGRRQISQNLLLYITECYIHRELKRSVLSVDLMSLCAFVCSVHLCSSVRKEYKSFVGNYISHRFSQMNRSLSTHRGNPQTPAGRRQISQNLLLYITECYIHRDLKRSVLSVDLMSLCAFVPSVHLCSSVRERTPSVTFLRSSVTLSPVSSNLFTRLLVHLLTCLVTLS